MDAIEKGCQDFSNGEPMTVFSSNWWARVSKASDQNGVMCLGGD